MATTFKKTIKPILILNKIVGIISFSYTIEPVGFLIWNTDPIYLFLELTRMCVLLMCSAYINQKSSSFLIPFFLFKHWYYVIAGRLSVKWMIKYDINIILIFINEKSHKIQLLLEHKSYIITL